MTLLHATRFILLVSLILVKSAIVFSWDCSINLQKFTIKDSSLVNGVARNRGIQVTLPGSQIVGLRFSWFFNNTLIRNDMDCQRGNSNVIQACQGASGSTFALGVYEGWNPLSDSFWAAKVQTVDSLPSGAISEKGIADVLFDDGPDVNLPIAVWNNPTMQLVYGVSSPAKSVLGMGPKSDLLQTLLNASMIPSKFMGLFFGSRSLNRPVDGELLIGGWDKSRVNGSFVNYTIAAFPMSIGCPLRVKVKRVILSNDRGSHPMLDEGQTVLACIDPLQNQLTFTDEMYDRWANETDHPNYNATPPYTFQTFPSANEHLIGTLYIELEGGYNTTVSNIELVSDERGPRLDDLGEYAPLNNSRIMASVGRGSTDYGEDFGMLLGGAWLASTYVFVDYENNKFGLAPAILGSTQSDVKTQCSKDASIPPPQAGANATTSSGSTTKTGTSTSDKIAIGVSIPAGVAAIATLAYMIYEGYRRRQERKQKELREARKLELEEQQKEVAKRQLELNAEEARERKESYTEFRRILSEVSMGSTGAGVSPLGGRSPDIGPSSPASGGEMRDAFGIERRV